MEESGWEYAQSLEKLLRISRELITTGREGKLCLLPLRSRGKLYLLPLG
ncbi:MAG: hypothetical protein K8I29_02375 [Alphaproteobacteria bacterium]|uniref:Uncharacterized protein n=1 Tax=Candidatus Nitrobium versatile TaxID=2884831 RepID=A0A953J9J7_9BACT|nr:hypothetical protein [Candidatus Nitrobium versatile]